MNVGIHFKAGLALEFWLLDAFFCGGLICRDNMYMYLCGVSAN